MDKGIKFAIIAALLAGAFLAVVAALWLIFRMGQSHHEAISTIDAPNHGKARSDLTTLRGMLQMFRLDCDRYPTTEEGLNACLVAPPAAKGWKGPYIDAPIPLDPWNTPYKYVCLGSGPESGFIISSNGPDRQPDTADYIRLKETAPYVRSPRNAGQ